MKLLREPLFHFLLLGAALFVWFDVMGGSGAAARPDRIVVSPGLIENLALSFENSTERKPTAAELDTLIDEYVREEILTREAIALGLHHDDPIVRRQLRQRVEFLHNDAAAVAPPTDEDLRAFFELNPGQFSRRGVAETAPPTFEQVRVAVERAWHAARRKDALDAAYAKLRENYDVVIEKSGTAK